MVANEFVGLAESAGDAIVKEELVSAYVGLLKDQEAEVRTAAASQIPGKQSFPCFRFQSLKLIRVGFSKLIDRDVILARIVPCVQALSSDSSQHVRASLAQQISGLAPLLGKDSTIEVLVPLYLQLLKDDFSEVRLNLISKLEVVNDGEYMFPSDFLPGFIPPPVPVQPRLVPTPLILTLSDRSRQTVPSDPTRRHGTL
jgi:serine/threonine-protein phosphatase 2A regulatory subunit A